MSQLIPFPTPDAALVKATLAVAEAEQVKAQLEHVRSERDALAEQLDSITYAALRVKRATTELERQMALSLLLAKALAVGTEERPCPTCEQYRCESDCPERR